MASGITGRRGPRSGRLIRHHERSVEDLAEQAKRTRDEGLAVQPEQALRQPAHADSLTARDDHAGAVGEERRPYAGSFIGA